MAKRRRAGSTSQRSAVLCRPAWLTLHIALADDSAVPSSVPSSAGESYIYTIVRHNALNSLWQQHRSCSTVALFYLALRARAPHGELRDAIARSRLLPLTARELYLLSSGHVPRRLGGALHLRGRSHLSDAVGTRSTRPAHSSQGPERPRSAHKPRHHRERGPRLRHARGRLPARPAVAQKARGRMASNGPGLRWASCLRRLLRVRRT